MDGTLTHAIHDFDAIRSELGLPQGKPILEAIASLPAKDAADVAARLDTLEYEIADQASARPGCVQLLDTLLEQGHRIGIVTRNGYGIAKATLKACQLDSYFDDDAIISRDCCAPKPDPAGIELLLTRWSTCPTTAVMVGDYLYDMQAGRRAGVTTVHLDFAENLTWPAETDFRVTSLSDIVALWS